MNLNTLKNFLIDSSTTQYESLWAYTERVGFFSFRQKWDAYATFAWKMYEDTQKARANNSQVSIFKSAVLFVTILCVWHVADYLLDAEPLDNCAAEVEASDDSSLPTNDKNKNKIYSKHVS